MMEPGEHLDRLLDHVKMQDDGTMKIGDPDRYFVRRDDLIALLQMIEGYQEEQYMDALGINPYRTVQRLSHDE